MGVRIDESGENCRVREINYGVARRSFEIAGSDDARYFVSFDHNRSVRERVAAFHVKQVAGLDDYPIRRLLRCDCGAQHQRRSHNSGQQIPERHFHCALPYRLDLK
jgi:hypothetical protein